MMHTTHRATGPRRLAILVTLFAAVLTVAPLMGVDLPDAPDFKRTVNYGGWYRDALPDVDDEENAWSVYVTFMPELDGSTIEPDAWPLFRGMLTSPHTQGAGGFATGGGDAWPPGPGPWRAALNEPWALSVERTADVLKAFRAAAKRKALVMPVSLSGDGRSGRIVSLHYPHVRYQRDCALGLLEAAWQVQDGAVSAKRLGLAIEALLRTARQMRGSLSIEEQAAAVDLRLLAYEHLRWGFAIGVFDEKNADNVARVLKRHDAQRVDASPAVAGECAKWLDALQYIFSPFSGGKGAFNGNRYREMTGQSMGGGNRFGIGARLETDAGGAGDAIVHGHEEMARRFKGSCSSEKHGEIVAAYNAMRNSHGVNKGLFLDGPRLASLYAAMARAECERRGAMVLSALFMHKAKHGRWPDELSKLDGGATTDIYGDKPFVYRLIGEAPVLYIVGPDCEDDGGIHDLHAGDLVLWPPPDGALWIAACRLNLVPADGLTKLSTIDKSMVGRTIVVAGEVGGTASEINPDHGRIHRVRLSDEGEAEMIFYQATADGMKKHQMPESGMKIRARVKVIESEGALKLLLESPENLAVAR